MSDAKKSRFILVIDGNGHAAAALLEKAGFSVVELRLLSRIVPVPSFEKGDLDESGDTPK